MERCETCIYAIKPKWSDSLLMCTADENKRQIEPESIYKGKYVGSSYVCIRYKAKQD